MKKILMILAALVLAVSAKADNSHGYAAATGVGVFFQTNSANAALTYTPSTIVGPGILLKKLMFFPNTSAAASVTVTVWDTGSGGKNDSAAGVTGATGSRIIVPTMNAIIPSVTAGPFPWVIDFTAGCTPGIPCGILIKGYLTIATSGTNTPNAVAVYEKSFINKVQGTNGTN